MFSDIIIVGGGASGLMCGIIAAENNKNKKVTIIEKQAKVGRKLMSTGNGRCNLTNTNSCRKYYHGSFSKYIDSIFEKCNVSRLLDIFSNLGLTIRNDEEGRVYPYSNHASSVLDVLRIRLGQLNVEIHTDTEIQKITKRGKSFFLSTNNGEYKCDKLVMCTGSKASPKLGADAKGLDLLRNLGHNITPLAPALCQIPVDNKFIKNLKGVRSNGRVSLYCNDKLIKEEAGEIQFTENALSGICVFNLSSYLRKEGNYHIEVSLLPHISDAELSDMLSERKNIMHNCNVENLFTGIFVNNLGVSILMESGIDLSRKISSLSDNDLKKIAFVVNHRKFKVVNKLTFEKAQVVSGGVNGREINPDTMESRIVKNLFICGEAIDINGDCGGYNLQFAFASGIIAGENL